MGREPFDRGGGQGRARVGRCIPNGQFEQGKPGQTGRGFYQTVCTVRGERRDSGQQERGVPVLQVGQTAHQRNAHTAGEKTVQVV